MRLRLTLFGHEVFNLDLNRQDPEELLAEAINNHQPQDDDQTQWTGASQLGCHIERSPETDDWGEDRAKGFGFGK